MSGLLQVSMNVASSALQAQSVRMRVASENMANANSTGATAGADPYARKTVAFRGEFDDALGASIVRISRIGVDDAPFRLEHDPDHPAANDAGFVKLPNVNMLVEMADVREASRSYEANLQVIKQARAMISMTIDLLRG